MQICVEWLRVRPFFPKCVAIALVSTLGFGCGPHTSAPPNCQQHHSDPEACSEEPLCAYISGFVSLTVDGSTCEREPRRTACLERLEPLDVPAVASLTITIYRSVDGDMAEFSSDVGDLREWERCPRGEESCSLCRLQ